MVGNVRSLYDDFPIISYVKNENMESNILSEISFFGERNSYSVCYVDMISSTKVAAQISEEKVRIYYSLFLNSMATIARNFRAKIIKNAGDCLILYFPHTANSNDVPAFKDVIECGMTMIAAHRNVNTKLLSQNLPSLSYRISADYGQVEVAKSSTSSSDDLFGSLMNRCAKINSKAPPNGMIIGNGLYQIVKDFSEYLFESGEYSVDISECYDIYVVKCKDRKIIFNPLSRKSKFMI